ncbi:MAG: hypothetical protein J3R72DRAFT_525475 [Linnemannia gamsii]|nr:MAG: hypothetical protein J3R72DRAFT_525475 [Linnemannia gamsii]
MPKVTIHTSLSSPSSSRAQRPQQVQQLQPQPTGRNNSNTLTNNQRSPARRTPYDRPAAPASNYNSNNTHIHHQSSKSRSVDEDVFDDIDINEEDLADEDEDDEDEDDDGFDDIDINEEDLADEDEDDEDEDDDGFDDVNIPLKELDEGEEEQDEDNLGDIQLTQEDLYDFDSSMDENSEDNDEIEDEKGDDEFDHRDDRAIAKKDLAAFFTRAGAEARARYPTAATTTTTNKTPARSVPTAAAPAPNDSNGQITTQQAYSAFLERIRTGQDPTITHRNSTGTIYRDLIRIPDQFLFTPVAVRSRTTPIAARYPGIRPAYSDVQRKFLLEIYPDLATAPKDSRSMMENVVLTHSKDTAEMYNSRALEMQSHVTTPSSSQQQQQARTAGGTAGRGYQEKTYVAISSPLHDRDYEMQDMVTAHWLNPEGMPPHELFLRVGHPVILLKTIGPRFQAGTRMIIRRLNDFSITAEAILDPSSKYSEPPIVTIPRMEIQSPNAHDIGCLFTRLQLPIKHAFALSLGDAVGKGFTGLVGVDLRCSVDQPRQLYSLLACCKDFRKLRVYVEDGEVPGKAGKYTRHVGGEIIDSVNVNARWA